MIEIVIRLKSGREFTVICEECAITRNGFGDVTNIRFEGLLQKELETVNYGDECPIHGETDCADVRKAYDRGYASGLYEALTLFKLIEADTPQTERSE